MAIDELRVATMRSVDTKLDVSSGAHRLPKRDRGKRSVSAGRLRPDYGGHMQSRGDPRPWSVREFFGRVVPAILDARRTEAGNPGGRLAFRIFGENEGAWSVDLERGTVDERLDPDAELLLEITEADLLNMFAGRLAASDAVTGGRVRYRGQLAQLENFAAALAAMGQ
jgi:hypothetical protein